MSVNRELPHLLVLPEDDANRQIAIGFQLSLDWAVQRRMQVLNPAGGWRRVLEGFSADHVAAMDRIGTRFMLLLFDFDGDLSRCAQAAQSIPARLADRVFVLGALRDPEGLRRAGLGTYEDIGSKIAADCRQDTGILWTHDLLRHNGPELDRLRAHLRPILFEYSRSSLNS